MKAFKSRPPVEVVVSTRSGSLVRGIQSQDISNLSDSPDDRMIQSHFYVFLAVGKLLFGRQEHSQAMQFASGMVGAKPLVVNEPPSLKNLDLPF